MDGWDSMPKRMTKRAKTDTRTISPDKYAPKGFKDEQSYLEDMRKRFSTDISADSDNREAALEDSLFVAGDQWDAQVKARRERENKPVMTVNRLPAFIGQVVGNRRMNETVIKVTPDIGGNKKTAQLRQGLIRGIEKVSRADRAYNNAFQNAVICGIGNFQLSVDYAYDDVFEQDICIKPVNNPLAVVWDANSVEPTGADAEHCYIIEEVAKADFDTAYKGASTGDLEYDSGLTENIAGGWYEDSTIRVVHHWAMQYEKRILWLMMDGDVRDVTDIDPVEKDELLAEVVIDDKTGEPYSRESWRSSCTLHICTGTTILEGPYTLPIKRVPVFRVPGWEIDTAYDRQRFGIVRFAKDPQRMHNYWRSVIVEKLMLTPKAPWVASDEAVKGREEQWRNAHLSNDSLLVYNGEAATPPQRTPPAQMEGALIQEAGMSSQDMKDVTNLHEASMGMTSNEVSGKAILARQKMGEIGSVVFLDNLDMAIEQCGGVINDLIPTVYDTERVVKTIDVDEFGTEQEQLQLINSEVSEDSIDITVGKYTVTAHTGPSQVTRRLEAAEGMLNMVNAMPDFMQVAAPEIVEAQDWPGAGKIAKRLRTKLGMVEEEDMSDEEKQAAQAAAAQAQKQQQMQEAAFMMELEEKKSKAALNNANAMKAEGQIKAAVVDMVVALQRVQNETDRVELDAIDLAAKIESMDVNDGRSVVQLALELMEIETAPIIGELQNDLGDTGQPTGSTGPV